MGRIKQFWRLPTPSYRCFSVQERPWNSARAPRMRPRRAGGFLLAAGLEEAAALQGRQIISLQLIGIAMGGARPLHEATARARRVATG